MTRLSATLLVAMIGGLASPARLLAIDPPPVVAGIEGQPLAQNAGRIVKTLDFLGTPFAAAEKFSPKYLAYAARRVNRVPPRRIKNSGQRAAAGKCLG